MGLFDKIKEKLNIGGAKVTVQLGDNAIANGATLPITVIVQGGQREQQIQGISVIIKQHDQWTDRTGNGQKVQRTQHIKIAEQKDTTPFTLQAGEQKTFTYNLPVKTAVTAASGGVMGTLTKLNDMVTQQRHTWTVEGIAHIDGSMDPSNTVDLMIQL